MKPRVLVPVLVLAAVAAAALVLLLLGGDPDPAPPGPTDPETPRTLRPQVDWPDELRDADRERLEPLLLAVRGEPETALEAIEALRSPDLLRDLGPRGAAVVRTLRPVVEEALRVAPDRLGRQVVELLLAWTQATPEPDRERAASYVPFNALAAAAVVADDPQFRREMAILLGTLPGPMAAHRLRDSLVDESPLVRRQALRSLAARDPRAAREPFRRRLEEDEDPAIRAEIIRQWRSNPALRPAGVADVVRPFATSDGVAPPVRAAAIGLLGDLGGPGLLDLLAAAAEREDRETRLAVIEALGRTGNAPAGRILDRIPDPGEADARLSERLAWAKERCR